MNAPPGDGSKRDNRDAEADKGPEPRIAGSRWLVMILNTGGRETERTLNRIRVVHCHESQSE